MMSLPLVLLLTMAIPLITMMLLSPSLLITLLTLEMTSLSLILLSIFLLLPTSPLNILNLLILLTLGASEASIALSCLVLVTDTHGHDTIKSLSTLSN